MNPDTVLTDLRAWRDEFARAHGYDLDAMVAVLQERDRRAAGRVVAGVRRPPVSTRLGKAGAGLEPSCPTAVE